MDKEPTPRAADTTDPEDWTPLHGGNVNTVSRKGGVVRRQLSTASPAVHQLLRWLEAKGFQQVPRLLRVTGEAEFLSFLPGTSVFRPWPAELKGDRWPAELGGWLRRYHEAVQGFRLGGDATFLWGPSEPSPGMLVCHGDLGPWNLLQQRGALVGVIDWDLARYGDPLDDLAELALETVPLHPRLDETLGVELTETTRELLNARLETFCSAYGVPSETVLQHAPVYLRMVIDETRELAAREVEPCVSFARGGIPEALEHDLEHVSTHWLT